MRILLIAGGWSTERDVSLAGARGMESALRGRGHEVTFFDLRDRFDHLLETVDGFHRFADDAFAVFRTVAGDML